MKHVPDLTEPERVARRGCIGPVGRTARGSAQAVRLSAQGFTLDQLATVCGVDRDTVSRWLDAWQECGLDGLSDAPKPGRPRAA